MNKDRSSEARNSPHPVAAATCWLLCHVKAFTTRWALTNGSRAWCFLHRSRHRFVKMRNLHSVRSDSPESPLVCTGSNYRCELLLLYFLFGALSLSLSRSLSRCLCYSPSRSFAHACRFHEMHAVSAAVVRYQGKGSFLAVILLLSETKRRCVRILAEGPPGFTFFTPGT